MYRGEVPGYVVLEDGTVFTGFGFGAQDSVVGEVVFNTGMTGYQEVATDPSYHGQMVTYTYPMIGNYGAAEHLLESGEAHSRAIVVREIKNTAWNATCPEAWVDWLSDRGIVGVGGVDTRALTRRIREQGAMTACVAAGPDLDLDALLASVRGFPSMAGRDLASIVTCSEPYEWDGGAGPDVEAPEPRFNVVAYDFGLKWSILRNLAAVGCRVTVVPAHWTAEQTLALKPDGVFLSNGPGDPAAVGYAVGTIRDLLGKVPVFGICLGHQLMAQAVGLSTYKLKFGHRGINHPVRNYLTWPHRDHQPEPRLRGGAAGGGQGGSGARFGGGRGRRGRPERGRYDARLGVRARADNAPQPQRRHRGGIAAARRAGLLRAVSPGGRSRPA
jgi:carbamoyl-phosphate synthase small subunit